MKEVMARYTMCTFIYYVAWNAIRSCCPIIQKPKTLKVPMANVALRTVQSVFCTIEGKKELAGLLCARDKSAGMPGLFSHLLGSHV